VAWLHESLETGATTEHDLLREGLGGDELRALRLLSRSRASSSDAAYLAHLDLIARAAGPSGELARIVKLADLDDRSRHPQLHEHGWSPPYARAFATLRGATDGPLGVAVV